MNQELSPTEQQQVEKAAKEYANKSTAPDKETPDWIKRDFKAGVEWALQSLLPSRAQGFLEWVDVHYKQGVLNENMWYCIATDKFFTSKELYQKYQEYLKQQLNHPSHGDK